jgi:hypothetical protein
MSHFIAGFGDEHQSPLFVSDDNFTCCLVACSCDGFGNYMFQTVASGHQCIKRQVLDAWIVNLVCKIVSF